MPTQSNSFGGGGGGGGATAGGAGEIPPSSFSLFAFACAFVFVFPFLLIFSLLLLCLTVENLKKPGSDGDLFNFVLELFFGFTVFSPAESAVSGSLLLLLLLLGGKGEVEAVTDVLVTSLLMLPYRVLVELQTILSAGTCFTLYASLVNTKGEMMFFPINCCLMRGSEKLSSHSVSSKV